MAHFEAMRKKAEQEQAELMKKLNLNDEDLKLEDDYDDPELRALNAELKKQGKPPVRSNS